MILASYGFNVTPPVLQDFMRSKNLFDNCGVYFTAVDSYTGNAKVRYGGRFVLNGRYEILRKLINSNGYAIAWVKSCGHFVLVYGYQNGVLRLLISLFRIQDIQPTI